MRRRQTGPSPEDMPPPELRRFDPATWAGAVPVVDRGTGDPSFEAWREARHRWRDRHGWPVDGLEFVREHRAERLRLVFGEDSDPYRRAVADLNAPWGPFRRW